MTSVFRPRFRALCPTACLVALAFAAGCGSASVTPTYRTAQYVHQPDMLVVHNFSFSPSQVELDEGMAATAVRDSTGWTQTQEELIVGRAVSEALARTLVDELRKAGITAYRAHEVSAFTQSTLFLFGRFVTVDGGNQSLRTWVGFGLGRSELRTQFKIYQGKSLLGEAESVADSGLKPGIAASLGVGAAAGTVGAAAAVGAGGAAVSEALLAGVEADARRTAKEIAKQIAERYRWRGWVPAK